MSSPSHIKLSSRSFCFLAPCIPTASLHLEIRGVSTVSRYDEGN